VVDYRAQLQLSGGLWRPVVGANAKWWALQLNGRQQALWWASEASGGH